MRLGGDKFISILLLGSIIDIAGSEDGDKLFKLTVNGGGGWNPPPLKLVGDDTADIGGGNSSFEFIELNCRFDCSYSICNDLAISNNLL